MRALFSRGAAFAYPPVRYPPNLPLLVAPPCPEFPQGRVEPTEGKGLGCWGRKAWLLLRCGWARSVCRTALFDLGGSGQERSAESQ
jgi:hypothetical protein